MTCSNYLWLAAPFSLMRQTLTNHRVGSKLLPPTITVIVWERERKKKNSPLLLSWFVVFLSFSFHLALQSGIRINFFLFAGETVTVVEPVRDESCSDIVVSTVHPVAHVPSSSGLEVVHYPSSTFAFSLNYFIFMPALSSHRVRQGSTGCFLQQLQWCDGNIAMIPLKRKIPHIMFKHVQLESFHVSWRYVSLNH